MTVEELGQKVKAKHPEYAQMDDADVGNKVVAKFPEYQSQIDSGYSVGGLIKNAVKEVPRIIGGTAMQVKQGLYDVPKALLGLPRDIAQGKSPEQTELGQFTTRGTQGMAEGIRQAVLHPLDTAYRNPIQTALTLYGLKPSAFGGAGAGRIMKPTVPPELLGDVATAEKYGVPLTRFEMTGSRPAGMAEEGFSSTLTGSPPIQNFRKLQAQKVQAAADAAKSQFGTQEPPSSSGSEGLLGLQKEMGANRATARQLYKDIPDVPIKTPGLSAHVEESVTDPQIMADPKVARVLRQVQDLIQPQEQATESTFPESFGSSTYEKKIPARVEGVGFTKKYIPESVESVPIQSQYRVGPSEIGQPEGRVPTFQKLNDLRNTIQSEINSETTYHPLLGPQTSETGAKLMRIKNVLDKDIDTFASQKPLPVVEPGSKTGDPHAIFAYNEKLGAKFPEVSKYQVFGNPNHPFFKTKGYGTQMTLEELQKEGIPVVGRTPRSVGRWNPTTETLESTLGGADQFKTAFQKARSFYKDTKDLEQNKLVKKISRLKGSDLADAVFKPGRVEDLRVAKAALGTDGFKAIQKQFFNQILDSSNPLKEMSKYDPEFIQEAFSRDASTSLGEIGSLKKTAQGAKKLEGNTSRTAQTGATLATGGGLYHALQKATVAPGAAALEAGAILGLPYVGAKAYLASTRGIPVGGAVRAGTGLMQFAGANQARKRFKK